MKNVFFSIVWLPVALICAPSTSIQSPTDTKNINDSTGVEIVVMQSEYECCGGDLEEPIVLGRTKTSTNQPISGATVTVYEDGNSTPLGSVITDANGDFGVQLVPDDYYFVIDAVGYSVYTSVVFTINADRNETFVL